MKKNFSALHPNGFTILQIIIWALIGSAVIGGFFILLNNERAKTRDAKRVSDMTRVQAAFEVLFATSASYASAAEAGCDTVGEPVSACNVSFFLPDITTMADPGGSSYVMAEVPDDDGYAVSFTLERAYGLLVEGQHVLTQDGIR
ncbi:MAG: hypothetical protein A2898_00060 [Candidatus Kerfeldbacteria bacterium RIFCSPLOWO2_01_FULL_48_11]|uniref:Type II secretion system protein GspG C-terminal domain-containing protein n=1 Tax=Candidatus Kerfeldbacteria bacterium RIFCSPLOWO2_01_FULL_48_11 TaxID=1798543 RepID=A0A1G2B5C1_9BACT|nr:MAG: hypothetical protein UY34_C0004G0014 [Parcubacteria group bacterium GW2011_GWA2_48_9]KKW14467.1 MAG: hypothetical protein UY52_C0027G0009 [Parcubacteria group bacterium GW2011_GWC2_49_9]OGY84352.1 MAG: hypothetical protein A2898_00060 [Candidatus Kerfeldbacteria bacterium RIFCSPLOWO2_01_FULL_48_11]HCM67813.1 hypothetical protein [Candidatus Kerfeldbacteria bacterium]